MRPSDQHINLPQSTTRKGFQTLYGFIKACAQPVQNKFTTQLFSASFLPFLIFSCLMSHVSCLHAQEERSLTRDGNKQFDKQKYADAEASYKKALETKNNFPEAVFNLGDAMYKQGRYDDAAKQFQLASKLLTDSLMKARAFHNLGNCSMEKNEYEEAVRAYKQALRLNPSDRDTKYNLAYANAKLKDNSQNNKQNKNDQNKQDKDKKDNKKDQNKKDQDKNGQGNNDKDKKDQQGKDDKDKKDPKDGKDKDGQGDKKDQQSKKNGGTMTKEQADKLLEALKAEEQKTQEKMQKKTAKPQEVKVEKDW